MRLLRKSFGLAHKWLRLVGEQPGISVFFAWILVLHQDVGLMHKFYYKTSAQMFILRNTKEKKTPWCILIKNH